MAHIKQAIRTKAEITRTELDRMWSRTFKTQQSLENLEATARTQEVYHLLNSVLATIEAAQTANTELYEVITNS